MIIPDTENVARALFSPKMIVNGEIQPEALVTSFLPFLMFFPHLCCVK